MAFLLESTEGPTKGKTFKVKPGFKVGRSAGDIILNDAKVSSNHAVIEIDHQGRYFLVDLDSSNGLKINGVRQKKVALTAGLSILVGKTMLLVVEEKEGSSDSPPSVDKIIAKANEEKSDEGEAALAQASADAASDEQQAPIQEHKTWRDQIIEKAPNIGIQNFSGAKKSMAFNPALKLTFIGGIQMDSVVVLGYGPRRIGADVLDIGLLEEACPAVAFEISPTPTGNFFTTKHPQMVFLNDQSSSSSLLKPGDTIRIGNTIIRIDIWESQNQQEQ